MQSVLLPSLIAAAMLFAPLAAADQPTPPPAPSMAMPAAPAPKYTDDQLKSPAFMKKVSESYGHLLQKSLDNPYLQLDFNSVVKGMQDSKAGKPSPMNEEECEEALGALQELAFKQLAEKNLAEANTYLKDNAKKTGVKVIEPGKLEILVLQTGTGPEVKEHSAPMITYKGSYANGTVFGSSEDAGGPITISVDQVVEGFRKGIVGMKEGEKRRLFIHPDLGYGTGGQLMPNSLLIFEVEVVKAQDKLPEPQPQMGQGGNLTTDADDDDDEWLDDQDNGMPEFPPYELDEEPLPPGFNLPSNQPQPGQQPAAGANPK